MKKRAFICDIDESLHDNDLIELVGDDFTDEKKTW